MMQNLGPRWKWVRDLSEGGQAQTYLVEDLESGGIQRVAKILKNMQEERQARFRLEIDVTMSFDHPNVVRSIAYGETDNKKKPFLVMPYYEMGTLEENFEKLGTPLDRLQIFLGICRGVEYAHSKDLVHRDLKPENIFLSDSRTPVVGDFGLCYREVEDQERNTRTSEAIGARKYMPPEWREGRVENPCPTGDIYSLGKILYWFFRGRVFDGNEEDHSVDHPLVPKRDVLGNSAVLGLGPPISLKGLTYAEYVADQIVRQTVLKKPEGRVQTLSALVDQTVAGIDRAKHGARALDFNLPKPCMFCAKGVYQLPKNFPFKPQAARLNPRKDSREEYPFQSLQHFVTNQLGIGKNVPGQQPLYLVCNHCGNVQYFRFDLTEDKSGLNWNP